MTLFLIQAIVGLSEGYLVEALSPNMVALNAHIRISMYQSSVSAWWILQCYVRYVDACV